MVGACNATISFAQEHPTLSTEAPFNPKLKSNVTVDDVAAYLTSYVKNRSKNGLFLLMDQAAHKELALKLVNIHRGRLAEVGPDTYFVCSDFATADGKHTYDLDFFVQGKSKDDLSVLADRTSIHKKDGKARYTWAFNTAKGVWEQKPAETKAKEHPAQQ